MFEIQKIAVSKSNYAPAPKGKYSDYDSPAKQAVMEIVDGLGQHRIGSGAFGVVYGVRGSDVVYKVCKTSTNGAYMSFVKQLSKQQQDNPFLPKIYGCAVFTSDARIYSEKDSYFVVVMERLNDQRPAGFYDAINTVEALCDPYESRFKSNDLLPGIKTVVPRVLRQAVSLLKRAKRAAGNDASWDLHGGNFMIRGTNQLVVIDPLA